MSIFCLLFAVLVVEKVLSDTIITSGESVSGNFTDCKTTSSEIYPVATCIYPNTYFIQLGGNSIYVNFLFQMPAVSIKMLFQCFIKKKTCIVFQLFSIQTQMSQKESG